MKACDIHLMKAIHHRVNLIPVIAKADGFTEAELAAFKVSVSAALLKHGIRVFTPSGPELRTTYEVHYSAQGVAAVDAPVGAVV